MFFPVARLRLLASLLLAPVLVASRDQSLFTSSVTYCAPPESLLVEQFDIAYYAKNQSIVFNISAASVDPNTNVNANLFLNVYGMQPINVSIDICSLFGGALCPLPLYTFNGSDSISLPQSLNIQSRFPTIAYSIPDLEAFAQLTLTDVKTGDVKACVQTTLSNGWSTHQYGVEWATASIAILALAVAIWQSVTQGDCALAPIRFVDTISLFQTIALSGLLSLNFPSLYRSYTLNFAWAMGLFSASTTSSIQQSINRMRHLTGGDPSNSGGNGAIDFVNRKLSPYNSQTLILPESLSRLVEAPSVALDFVKSFFPYALTTKDPHVLVGGDVATVTQDSSNVLQAGIPIYTNSIGIATANAFMTILFIGLILAAILLASLALVYGATVLLCRTELARRYPEIHGFRSRYPSFARAWGLRGAMVSSLPILVFAFYQWTLKDSWLSVLLSVLVLIALMAIVLPDVFFATRASISKGKWSGLEAPAWVAPLTSPYRPNRVYYVIPLLVVMVIKALVTAFAHGHGTAQIIIFVVLEFLFLLSTIALKPHRTRGADILAGYLCITRLVSSGLMIAFAESLAVKPIPRVAIGAIVAVIFSVAVVVMFLNILVNMGLWRLLIFAFTCGRRGRGVDHATLASQSSDASMVEQGNYAGTSKGLEEKDSATVDSATVDTTKSQDFPGRPNNPTPPSTASFSPKSLPSATSSTTLGETLPRRWSFQHSRPPSISTDGPYSPAYTYRTSTASSPISGQRHSRNISSSVPTPLDEHHEYEKYEARAV
ncbi:TRP-domain-containing protein [Dichomitus squalens]|uniref:TRP-domain-containing protein n=1 Tax=Dichomitus squalens TaxID=114155 RepID=A0A4Q9M9R4_9APHY|nr:TRP-domain-containing protein [Dichomitus squalens]